MAKLEECRIYQSNDALPVGWSHPRVVLLAKKFSKLGIVVLVPLELLTGKQNDDRFTLPLDLFALNYRVMHKREQDKLIHKKDRERLAE